ncbi:MAG: hypothetical protein GY789_28220 [Hyphomicrobiales bacterium]|nr:hypothetical protein [Hyphomicrobiales bacterium]MCP5000163.1 hypothetical protein [Hyphomicrobiales bacterium]
MIYVSFPKPPHKYPRRAGWHCQLSHQIFHGLARRFGKQAVELVDWEKVAPVGPRDLIVTFLPNINYYHTDRIIGIENDTLIPERWSSPVFCKFGIEAPVDDLRELTPLLANAAGFCVLSNDVAIGKLRAGDSATTSHVDFFRRHVDGNYVVCPHPIDKPCFRRIIKGRLKRNGRFSRHRMAVYHRDWRKYSQATIDLLDEMGYREGREYSVIDWVKKSNPITMRRFVSKFNIVFSGSCRKPVRSIFSNF